MKFLIALVTACMPAILVAQTKVFHIPFEFEKKLLAASDYDAYFLENPAASAISLVLKDNRKTQYLQLGKKFEVLSKIDLELNSTVFKEDITDYRGGTANGNVFYFIYEEKEKKAFSKPVTRFQLETVDFAARAVTHSVLFEIPKAEKVLSSFSDNNAYYTITADDKAKELVFYVVNDAGAVKEQRIPFTVPEGAGKERDHVSEYFKNLRVFKTNEEPDLSNAVSQAKLFSFPDKLSFVINNEGHDIHLFTVQLPDLTVKENFIDVDGLKKESKDKIYVNSFLRKDKLFSLVLNRKNIQLAVHDIPAGNLLGKQEINEDSDPGLFALPPVTEKRMGKKASTKDVDNVKKLIRALDRGTEGLMVTENKKQQFVVTIGTYDLIPIGGSSGGGWVGGWTTSTAPAGSAMPTVTTWNPNMYYRPGLPSYAQTNARYYTTTYFRLLIDSSGKKYARGDVPFPVAEQVKDYMQDVDPKTKAINQFAIGTKQYFGHYNKETRTYDIEEIRVR